MQVNLAKYKEAVEENEMLKVQLQRQTELENEKSNLELKNQEMSRTINEYEIELQNKNQTINRLVDKYNSLTIKLKDMTEKCDRHKIARQRLEHRLWQHDCIIPDLQNKIATEQAKIRVTKRELERLKLEMVSLKNENEELKSKNAELLEEQQARVHPDEAKKCEEGNQKRKFDDEEPLTGDGLTTPSLPQSSFFGKTPRTPKSLRLFMRNTSYRFKHKK